MPLFRRNWLDRDSAMPLWRRSELAAFARGIFDGPLRPGGDSWRSAYLCAVFM